MSRGRPSENLMHEPTAGDRRRKAKMRYRELRNEGKHIDTRDQSNPINRMSDDEAARQLKRILEREKRDKRRKKKGTRKPGRYDEVVTP